MYKLLPVVNMQAGEQYYYRPFGITIVSAKENLL